MTKASTSYVRTLKGKRIYRDYTKESLAFVQDEGEIPWEERLGLCTRAEKMLNWREVDELIHKHYSSNIEGCKQVLQQPKGRYG